jgi:hypothetical protein
MLLIALPILFFVSIFLNLLGAKRFVERELTDWRTAFLMASLCWGILVVVISEGLSIFDGLSRLWVAILWFVSLGASAAYGLRYGTFRRAFAKIKLSRPALSRVDGFIILGSFFIVCILAVVALVSLPSNIDSLLYHIARVAHWIQNASLNHYPTSYRHQLWNPPFAEMAMLHLQLLVGNSTPVNMVQWFSMAGSLVGLSALASLMGASLRGQLLTVSFAISVPMGILQATSTQNDYVTTFWLVTLAYFVALAMKRSLSQLEVVSLALAMGLGMLTKSTFYVYMVPFLAWYFMSLLMRSGTRKMLTTGALIAGIVLLLNLGYWTRNIITFGGPLGSEEWVKEHSGVRLDPGSFASALLIGMAQNVPTSILQINDVLMDGLEAVHHVIGEDLGDFQLVWAWNHEDRAGSPLHLFLIPLSVGMLYVLKQRETHQIVRHYSLATLATYLLIPLIIVDSINPFSIRYQLPFFILGAAIFGIAFSDSKFNRVSGYVAIFLILTSLPWVFLNNSRPIIAMRTGPEPLAVPCTDTLGCTRISSIFRSSDEDVIMAKMPSLKEPITAAVEVIKDSDCKQVGLRIDSHDPEYPFWWMLDVPKNVIRIETIYTFPELERFVDPTFEPCAIICTICGDRSKVHGLDWIATFGHISVYGGSGYTREPDG